MNEQMKVKIHQVAGIEHALTWMRYAKQSEGDTVPYLEAYGNVIFENPTLEQRLNFVIGPRDERLAAALVKAPRDSHAKMCRVIQVWMDIRATLKWWKQFDTYKIGTTALSTSTMNSLMDRPLTKADFTDMVDWDTIQKINRMIETGNEEKALANLPLDYLQLRGVLLNYQVLRNIWIDRHGHKLQEWQGFIEQVRAQCPYANELIFVE